MSDLSMDFNGPLKTFQAKESADSFTKRLHADRFYVVWQYLAILAVLPGSELGVKCDIFNFQKIHQSRYNKNKTENPDSPYPRAMY
jgi:hypothetical protein